MHSLRKTWRTADPGTGRSGRPALQVKPGQLKLVRRTDQEKLVGKTGQDKTDMILRRCPAAAPDIFNSKKFIIFLFIILQMQLQARKSGGAKLWEEYITFQQVRLYYRKKY